MTSYQGHGPSSITVTSLGQLLRDKLEADKAPATRQLNTSWPPANQYLADISAAWDYVDGRRKDAADLSLHLARRWIKSELREDCIVANVYTDVTLTREFNDGALWGYVTYRGEVAPVEHEFQALAFILARYW